MSLKIKTPVLLVLFNRPDVTEDLFDILNAIGEFDRVYISIDGPRGSQDLMKVNRVRELAKNLCFSKDVKVRELSENLGCKNGVSSAIDWFFDQEEHGIILEDDCHPTTEFFLFMEAMLCRYRNDNRVAQICGSNTLGAFNQYGDYFYSNFGNIWGWGSWRRSWRNYDREMRSYSDAPNVKFDLASKIHFLFDGLYRIKNFDDVLHCKIDTWDYQWIYSRLAQNQVCVIPSVSLVTNVGIGSDATHTFQSLPTVDKEKLDRMRRTIHWANPCIPDIMLPAYKYELAVAEYKRGWRGFGPIFMSKKAIGKIVRHLRQLMGK